MQKHGHKETQLRFHRRGGHDHDGKTSSKINFNAYSEEDLQPLFQRIRKMLQGGSGGESDEGNLTNIVTIGDVALTDAVTTPTNLVLTTGSSFEDSESVWIHAEWELPSETPEAEDDSEDLIDLDFGDDVEDDTDATDLEDIPDEQVQPTIEYEVSLFRTGDSNAVFTTRTQNTFFHIFPVDPNTDYTVEVRGVNHLNIKSDAVSDEIVSEFNLAPAPSDGVPPSSSPTPVLTGGPNYIYATWPEIENQDTVAYEVHISESSGFTPSGSTLTAKTYADYAFIRKLQDGSPLEYDTTYYVKIIAFDNDGAAAAGTQDSEQMNPIDGAAGDIVAGSVTAELLESEIVLVNQFIESENYDTGVDGWHIDGDGGAEFNDVLVRGQLVASSITGNMSNNLIPNGTFETNVTGWTADNSAVLSQSNTFAHSGTYSMKVDAGAAGTINVVSDIIAIEPRSAWRGNAWVRTDNIGTRFLRYNLRWLDSGQSTISEVPLNAALSVTAGAWYDTTSSVFNEGNEFYQVAPSNAFYLQVVLSIENTTGASENHYIDDVTLQQVPSFEGFTVSNTPILNYGYADPSGMPGGMVHYDGSAIDVNNVDDSPEVTLVETGDIKFQQGRIYKISFLHSRVSIAEEDAFFSVRIYVDGTLELTQLFKGDGTGSSGSDFLWPINMTEIYYPSVNHEGPVTVKAVRTAGSGTADFKNPFSVLVEDIGADITFF